MSFPAVRNAVCETASAVMFSVISACHLFGIHSSSDQIQRPKHQAVSFCYYQTTWPLVNLKASDGVHVYVHLARHLVDVWLNGLSKPVRNHFTFVHSSKAHQ